MVKMFEEMLEIFKIRVINIKDDEIAPEKYYKIDIQKYNSECYVTYNVKKETFNDRYKILDFVLFINKTLA